MREGWEYKKFEEVFDLQMGKTPSRDNPQYWGDNNIWVSIADLQSKYIDTTKEKITDRAIIDTNIKSVKKGTVIMSFKLTVGRCAIAAKDLFTNEAIMAFNPIKKDLLIPEFIYYYLKGYKWKGANKAVMGLTLNKKSISINTFAYPPLSEQQQIVDELDLLSSIIEKKKEQLKELDNLAQSIFYDMFGDPVTNEKGWEVHELGSEFDVSSGGTPSTKKKEYWDNGNISWIGSNMCQNQVIRKNDGKYITTLGYNNSSAKLYDKGYVLIALVGATIGKVALLDFKTTTNQNVAGVNVPSNKKFTSLFIFFLIQSLYILFENIGDGKFKMANLSFIRSLPIILPPLPLQQQFASRIESIERQKELIKQSIAEEETLFNSRMDYYFN